MKICTTAGFSCTVEEKALLKSEAKRAGLTFSEFIRQRLFGKVVRERPHRVVREADGNSRKRKLLPLDESSAA